ncbi:hypothetical protein [Streptomyces griseorubiginosus]|uniref:Cell division protein FtsK n=1 Tax=Streptomyces griseorubiginosus TaxID=67304 RepID=A0AAI8PN19_9ACTN|nr:hypothetical protein [Streptomyces griseorubiginosus]AYC38572.1 hypothetical protein DWG14_02802 [Streptomyces griseorubiginosus]
MKHPDDDNELFNRLEADMAADSDTPARGHVVDLDKARTARGESPDPAPDGSANSVRPQSSDSEPTESDTGRPTPVDSSVPTVSGPGLVDRIKNSKRLDVFPAWMKSRAEFTEALGWLAGHVGHTAAYHAVRVPFVYVPKLVWRSPRGALNILGRIGRWAVDGEGEALRQYTATNEQVDEYLKLSRQRDRRVRLRAILTILGAVFALGLGLFLVFGAQPLTQVFAVTVAVLGCGLAGAPADAPLATRAVIKTEVQKLTSDIVVKAMASIGIGQIASAVAKGQDGIRFVAPITREGPGWRADIDLPLGVTVADVADRRARLASGLRRPLGCVWPDADPNEHEGRLILWVGDRDLSKTGIVKWQLANARRHDIFKRNPFGIDPRGRAQSVPMIQHNILIGSLPGQGKTASVRVLACGAALDPSVELWLHENKGTGDLDSLECVSHRFVSGIERVWNERIAARLAELRPEVYGGWKGENVTSALKPHGITTRGVAGMTDDGERTTRRGIVRDDLTKVIAERDESRGAA